RRRPYLRRGPVFCLDTIITPPIRPDLPDYNKTLRQDVSIGYQDSPQDAPTMSHNAPLGRAHGPSASGRAVRLRPAAGNWAENSMRPVVLGRKNWIHVGSEQAGPKVAAVLSVVRPAVG